MSNTSAYNYNIVDLSNQVDPTTGFHGAKVTLVAQGIELPIAYLSLNYAINDIPTATATVALGRDARTNKPSRAYEFAKTTKRLTKAYIKLDYELNDWDNTGTEGAKLKFKKAANVILFTGYLAGISYNRTGGKVNLTVNLVSQLVNLSMTTGGTNHILPGTPSSLLMPSNFEGPGAKTVANQADRFTENLSKEILSDFKQAIVNVLSEIASDKYATQIYTKTSQLGAVSAETSTLGAKAAIEASDNWLGMSGALVNYLKLKISKYPIVVGSAFTPKQIEASIAIALTSSIYSLDLWGTLVSNVLPEFGCALIPFPRGGLIAPILPMYNKPTVILKSSEYVDFNMTANTKQPIRAVGLFYNQTYSTITSDYNPSQIHFNGSYVASEDVNDGGWFFKQAPSWLSNVDLVDTAENKKVLEAISKVSNNQNGGTPLDPDDFDSKVAEVSNVLGNYAKMIYSGMALKGRQGSLVGKLRFDISPGSTIKFELQPEQVTGNIDLLSTAQQEFSTTYTEAQSTFSVSESAFYFGFVNQVSIVIDSEQSYASTSFMLTNLRTKAENDLVGQYSLDSHPFFLSNFFSGANLIPELSTYTVVPPPPPRQNNG